MNRLTNRAINQVNESVAYDELGRITNHTSVLGSFGYAYVDATRRLSSLAYPNSQKMVLSYFGNTGDDRLQEIWNQTGSGGTISKFDYAYDVLGRITQWTQQADANPTNVMNLSYDAEDQLLGATMAPQGQSIVKSFLYGYDLAGNRTSEQIETAGSGFSSAGSAYNSVNELGGQSLGPVTFGGKVNQPAEVGVNGVVAKMTQDPNSASNGKIFEAAVSLPAGNNTVTVVATNFALPTPFVTTSNYSVTVAAVPGKMLEYDANGNLTNEVLETATNGYSWDANNQLVQITQLTNGVLLTSQFTYDGFGRRVKDVELNNGVVTSTKNFVWSGRRLCEERDASDNVTKRFLGEGEQINGTSYYFTFDHLGSVREMTDGSGAIRARYDYDPYGRRTKLQGDLDADFGFTGYYVHQPTGLQFALYRAYDADLGRFINRDPMGERGGLNLYRYVANSPINYYDPLGLSLSSFMNWLIPGWNDLYPDPSQSGSEEAYWANMANNDAQIENAVGAPSGYMNYEAEQLQIAESPVPSEVFVLGGYGKEVGGNGAEGLCLFGGNMQTGQTYWGGLVAANLGVLPNGQPEGYNGEPDGYNAVGEGEEWTSADGRNPIFLYDSGLGPGVFYVPNEGYGFFIATPTPLFVGIGFGWSQ